LLLAASILLVCRPCHQEIVDRWSASPMGATFGLVDAEKKNLAASLTPRPTQSSALRARRLAAS